MPHLKLAQIIWQKIYRNLVMVDVQFVALQTRDFIFIMTPRYTIEIQKTINGAVVVIHVVNL